MKKRILSLMAALVIGFGVAPSASALATETKADTKVEVKLPEFKGNAVDKAKVEERFNKTVENLKKLESLEMKVDIKAMASGSSFNVTGSGNLNVKDNKAMFELSFMGMDSKFYMDDKNVYTFTEGKWSKTQIKDGEKMSDVTKELEKVEPMKVDDNFMKVFEAIETADGELVIKNKEKIDAESLKMLIPQDQNLKEMTSALEEMAKSNLAMDVALVLDKDNNYKSIYVVGTVEFEGQQAGVDAKIDFTNYNKATPIEIPAEAMQ